MNAELSAGIGTGVDELAGVVMVISVTSIDVAGAPTPRLPAGESTVRIDGADAMPEGSVTDQRGPTLPSADASIAPAAGQ